MIATDPQRAAPGDAGDGWAAQPWPCRRPRYNRYMARGIVYLVGAGPGRADLITLAGLRRLERADVVVHDRLIDRRLLDRAPRAAERIFAGKRCGEHMGLAQAEINQLLIDRAREGKCVVRLKGGDPLTFARGSEEAEALDAAGIAYEIVPGVTAANAVAACASIPLTHREWASAVAWFTGHEDPAKLGKLEWKNLASFPGTLLAYMGVTRLRGICAALLEAGKPADTPTAVVEWGGVNCQRVATATLGDWAAGKRVELGSPALVVIGPVVALRQKLGWFERRPLFGQTVLIARPARQAAPTVERLEELGAQVVCQPVVEIAPLEDPAPLDAALERLRDFEWLVFASSNGVDHFFERLFATGADLRRIGNVQLAAIGPGTAAALARWHLCADFVPAEFHSEALAAGLLDRVAGKRALLVRADRGRTILEDELSKVARHVERLAVYRQIDVPMPDPEVVQMLVDRRVHWAILSSTNVAAGFLRWIRSDDHLQNAFIGDAAIQLASISPITSAAIRAAGFVPAVEATAHTLDGAIDAIVQNAQKRQKAEDRICG